jgi:hypothetical protein
MKNALDWFEIPATDLDRAVRFYNTILAVEMVRMEVSPGYPMAMFPFSEGVSGAVISGEGYTPGVTGTLVYLACGEQGMDAVLGRVEGAGGTIVGPKVDAGEHGLVAVILDTEGNRVGLHAER